MSDSLPRYRILGSHNLFPSQFKEGIPLAFRVRRRNLRHISLEGSGNLLDLQILREQV